MACANEAKVNEKATATNLIIASPPWMM